MKIIQFIAVNASAEEIGIPRVNADNATFATLMSLAFTAIGGVAVLFLLVGAVKYVTSNGDPGQTAKARNTIIYAIVGIAISAMAFTIVQFVLGRTL